MNNIVQVPQSQDLAISVLMTTTTEPITLPLTHMPRVIITTTNINIIMSSIIVMTMTNQNTVEPLITGTPNSGHLRITYIWLCTGWY